jgi:hypothetical protein
VSWFETVLSTGWCDDGFALLAPPQPANRLMLAISVKVAKQVLNWRNGILFMGRSCHIMVIIVVVIVMFVVIAGIAINPAGMFCETSVL